MQPRRARRRVVGLDQGAPRDMGSAVKEVLRIMGSVLRCGAQRRTLKMLSSQSLSTPSGLRNGA